MACYPGQQSPDENVAKAYARQLAECMAGVDQDVLVAMLNPKHGLVARVKFLPSIAEVASFIAEKVGPKEERVGMYLDEIASLEREQNEPEPVSPEERERRIAMLQNVSRVINETADKLRRPLSFQQSKNFGDWHKRGTDLIGADKMKPDERTDEC